MHIKNSTAVMFLYFTNCGMTPTANGTFSFEEPFNWNPGELTDFTIFTGRGNIFVFQDVT